MTKIGFAEALGAQPDNLEASVRAVAEAVVRQELPRWEPADTVSVVAMGASSHSAEALVGALRREGRFAVNLNAADIAHAPDGLRPGDHFVLVSESGRSPEPIDAARRLPVGRRVAITNDETSPLAGVVDHVVPLGGWPDSRVYTSGFTATLLAYAALVRHQVGPDAATDPSLVPDLVRRCSPGWAPQVAAAAGLLVGVRGVDVVAQGVSLAAATEGALVLREGARLHATGYDTYQYIHGPMESLDADSAVVVLGDDRELPLVDMALQHGIRTILLTAADPSVLEHHASENLVVVSLPEAATGIGRAVLETVFIQELTLGLTLRLGLDIDEFLYEQPDTKLATSRAE